MGSTLFWEIKNKLGHILGTNAQWLVPEEFYAREDMPEELCLMNIWMPVVSSIIYTTQLELGNFKLMRADGPRGRRT